MTIMTTRTSWPLWQPSAETLDTIAAVVAAHWTAAKSYGERTFWPTATHWLRRHAANLTFTTSREAGGSSGTPPGQRRY